MFVEDFLINRGLLTREWNVASHLAAFFQHYIKICHDSIRNLKKLNFLHHLQSSQHTPLTPFIIIIITHQISSSTPPSSPTNHSPLSITKSLSSLHHQHPLSNQHTSQLMVNYDYFFRLFLTLLLSDPTPKYNSQTRFQTNTGIDVIVSSVFSFILFQIQSQKHTHSRSCSNQNQRSNPCSVKNNLFLLCLTLIPHRTNIIAIGQDIFTLLSTIPPTPKLDKTTIHTILKGFSESNTDTYILLSNLTPLQWPCFLNRRWYWPSIQIPHFSPHLASFFHPSHQKYGYYYYLHIKIYLSLNSLIFSHTLEVIL